MENERPRRRRTELQQQLKKEKVLSENEEDSRHSHNTFLTPTGTENSNGFSNSGDDAGDVFVPGQDDDDIKIEFRRGRSNPYWTPVVEQVFIERIKSYPPLYDHSSEDWKNTAVKDVIWEEISQEVQIPACECKRHFKHMRDKFVRHKRTGRGSKTWKAGEAMNFLVEMDLIKHRPTKSPNEQEILGNFSHDTSKSEEMESPSPHTQVIDSANGVTVTLTQPLSTRSLRSASAIKRKTEDQNVNTTLRDKRLQTERTLEVPMSTLLKAPIRKGSNDIRIHAFTNGQPHDSQTQVPVMSTPQLLLSTLPQQLTTHKNEQTEPCKTQSNQGPNYFFGQYIASVLDALPQGESLMTRHKLQEILFEAQRKSVNPNPPQIIQFQCTNCTSLFSPI